MVESKSCFAIAVEMFEKSQVQKSTERETPEKSLDDFHHLNKYAPFHLFEYDVYKSIGGFYDYLSTVDTIEEIPEVVKKRDELIEIVVNHEGKLEWLSEIDPICNQFEDLINKGKV